MRKRIYIFMCSTAVLLSACDQIPIPPQDQDGLATAVEATLAASQIDDSSTPSTTGDTDDKIIPTATLDSPSFPVISMDDYLLAYTQNGDLWTTSAGDTQQQLTDVGDVVKVLLSDDRQLIIYVRQSYQPDLFELRAINTDGSNDRQVLSQDGLDSLYPLDGAAHYQISQMEFIPGSHTLLFNTIVVFDGPGLLKNDDLHMLDFESGTRSQILERGQGGDFTISPNGQSLAIAQADAIAIAQTDGSELRQDLVTFQPVITYSEYQYYPELVWASDSSRVGVFLPSPDPLEENPSGTVWLIPVTGEPQSLPSIQGQVFFPQSNGQSLLAPDLQSVAFLRGDSQGGTQTLLLADLDGSNSRVYDQGDLQWIGWSPDGMYFSYRREDNRLTLGTPGKAPEPLTEGRSLRWLPGGLYLAQAGRHGDWTLKLGQISVATEVLIRPEGDSLTFDIR